MITEVEQSGVNSVHISAPGVHQSDCRHWIGLPVTHAGPWYNYDTACTPRHEPHSKLLLLTLFYCPSHVEASNRAFCHLSRKQESQNNRTLSPVTPPGRACCDHSDHGVHLDRNHARDARGVPRMEQRDTTKSRILAIHRVSIARVFSRSTSYDIQGGSFTVLEQRR
jgi:hypothetical protein